MSRDIVIDTADFRRIRDLPRRVLDPAVADDWARYLNRDLVIPGSPFRLRRWQAMSLAELAIYRGAWIALPVGAGKTAITYLAPLVLGSKRPLLIAPAALRDKTYQDFTALRVHLKSPATMPRFVSIEELAIASNQDLLNHMQPDLVMMDEADILANHDSAAVKRLDRYRRANFDASYVALTGTPSRKSIMGYWHIVVWCRLDDAPMPLRESEALTWAAALDMGSGPPGRPGPLGSSRETARAWFSKRLRETPGVVIVDGDSCDQPITFRLRVAYEDPKLNPHFDKLALDDENPAGIPVTDGLSRYRLESQLGCGFFQQWDPPPPPEWSEARRAVAKFVRDVIARSQRSAYPIDTEAPALRRHKDHPIVRRWMQLKPTFEPKTKTVWISDSTIRYVQAWLDEDPTPGIVWIGSTEFAARLTKITGLKYYGAGGRDQHGGSILRAPHGKHILSSWHANTRGLNLQAWPRQLFVFPPQAAKKLEQVVGRSHRSGQDKPVVVDYLATSGGTIDSFLTAKREASFARDTIALTQKILRGRITMERPPKNPSSALRWARRSTRIEE